MPDTYICTWDNGEVSIETEPCANYEGPYTNAEARSILATRGFREIGNTCYFKRR